MCVLNTRKSNSLVNGVQPLKISDFFLCLNASESLHSTINVLVAQLKSRTNKYQG